MFAKLKNIFLSSEPQDQNGNNEAAKKIEQEISALENSLSKLPSDNDIQKKLMIKYNQAVKTYAANPVYRHHVDDIFIKIDELRNTIRKNI